ncbi:hypothetical protein [Defluviimonas sp. SAOS-178_SWC]|uniref:hypothetical protein n=1 Tax=Defluviimonas sp. SAOS-178_SWC TaxID=3121287 RepID=UPI003221F3E5
MPDRAETDLPVTAAIVRAALEAALQTDVELRETSMAWVFLTEGQVFKMKRPVHRRFFDFSSLEARHHACDEEVRLNRRLAPGVYLGLSRLTRTGEGDLALDGTGETVDWFVRMRRLLDARFLDHALGLGTATDEDIKAVAAALAGFHARAPVVRPTPQAYLDRYSEDIEGTRTAKTDGPFRQSADVFGRLLATLDAVPQHEPGLLLDRLEQGRVREGHGDLRPEHVWLGPPVLVIDCLEAARVLRLLDPFEEYATLAMECSVLGAGWVGPLLFGRVSETLDDRPGERLLAFYTAHRATLRARQALAHLLSPSPRTPERWRPLADRYLAAATQAVAILENRATPQETRSS